MDKENEINNEMNSTDDFLDKVSNTNKINIQKQDDSNTEAIDKVRQRKEARRKELEAEIMIKQESEGKQNINKNNNITVEEFEQQVINSQITEDDIMKSVSPEDIEVPTHVITDEVKQPKVEHVTAEAVDKLAKDSKVDDCVPVLNQKSTKRESNAGTDNVPDNYVNKVDPNTAPLNIPSENKSSTKEIEVITAEEAEAIEHKKEDSNRIGKVAPVDDFEKAIEDTREEYYKDIQRDYMKKNGMDSNEDFSAIVSKEYEDDESKPEETNNIQYEISDEYIPSNTEEKQESSKNESDENNNVNRNRWLGGDGETTSFKNRSAKISKILRNVEIEDTENIRGVDISNKSAKERNDFYMKNVLTTLQPTYTVIPCIVSGVVLSISALSWWDHVEICRVEEKLNEIEPDDEDYIYKKNMIFIEKRHKQIDIIYKHIIAVSGYDRVPDKDELFGKIIKFPDFPQLFFGVYCATFPKNHSIDITCGQCGYVNSVVFGPKDLCFLLNKNINIDRLNHYIQNGGSLNANETAEAYKEFQKEEFVENCNKIYRINKSLPNSAFIYELKIPSIYDAYDSLKEIADVFRDQSFEYITGNDETDIGVISVDASFGLPSYLFNIRKYMYLHSIMVAKVAEPSSKDEKIKINYVTIEDKNSVIGSIYNLSTEDYNVLMKDVQLNNLVKCVGIQHGLKPGKCHSELCGADMGLIPVDPEQLFFIVARSKLSN